MAALVDERLREGFRPRDVAVLVRSNGDADPFLRALNVKGIPHRFSGSRGLYAREEVRLLVHFLRVLAAPEDSVSVFYLAASELYRLPEADLIRLNRYARRKSRPLLEVMRGLPQNEELVGVGGAAREVGVPAPRRPRPRGGRGSAPTHGRGALRLPPVVGLPGLAHQGGERCLRGPGAQHRPLLRDREGLRRRGHPRPRARLRRPPRSAARGGRRPRGGRGRPRRGRGPRPHHPQGQGAGVPGGLPGGRGRGPVPPAAPRARASGCPPPWSRAKTKAAATSTRSGGSSTWP